jgi:hypothetical protein
VLYHTAALAGFDHFRFLTLPGLDATEKGGGKDPIIQYLKRNGALIRNRPREAPLVVLLDWEVSDQDLKRARDAYGAGSADRVIAMNADHCDLLLRQRFKGGSELEVPLKEAYEPQPGKQYHYKEGSDLGEHLRVNRAGDLEFWDQDGLIRTAQKR